ncbi:MAG: hypothetical protein O3A92_08895 [Verrucomicrobia bacterium]|nr:hypothetical protein [Verrucomicrobiota bacterium]
MALAKFRGGTPKCEVAVVRALDWLSKTQKEDGSWGETRTVAMTGLALLCFTGHGEGPVSEKHGKTYLEGLLYLVQLGGKQEGKL